MDTEDSKLNFEAVEELILDEEKLVTYLYVSQKLCIHVNESKKLLTHFVKKYPKDALNVKYIISGLIDNNKAITKVCSESELPAVRKDFKVVFFEHVYCVSKSPVDNNLILSVVNNYINVQSCLGAVKNTSCSKFSDAEINKKKNQSYNASLCKIVQKPALSSKTKPETVPVKEENIEKKATTDVKIESKSSNQTELSPKKKPESSTASKVIKNQPQKGIAGFFNKQNNLKKEIIKTPKNKIEETLKSTETILTNSSINSSEKSKVEKMEIDSDENMENNKSQEKFNLNKSSSKNQKSSNKFLNKSKPKQKSVEVLKKNAKVDKKRKRVLHIFDSDSDDEAKEPFEEEEELLRVHESEDEIPPTPTTNVVKVVSGAINPKKKRKVVDKVYTDEDGYILTKKEEVYESYSDNEEPVEIKPIEIKKEKENLDNKTNGISPNKKKVTKNKIKKVSPTQKGKQSTLMNFFSKK